MSLPKEEKDPCHVTRVRSEHRGGGDKLFKGPRPKGVKARLDEYVWARRQFFERLELSEMDRLYWPAEEIRRGYDHPAKWPGDMAIKDAIRSKKWRLIGRFWHYESMLEWRDKMLVLQRELEADGILPRFPDHLITYQRWQHSSTGRASVS